MESPQKSSPKRSSPSWKEIVAQARQAAPPPIDARPGIMAMLSQEQNLRRQKPVAEPSVLEGVIELFARPIAKLSLGAGIAAVASWVVVLAASSDFSELAEADLDDEASYEESYEEDWTSYL